MSHTEFEAVTFNELVGEEIIELILQKAPTKVLSRVTNAILHVEKAKKLKDIDVEMASIRFIAAEEELVVAIFEWLKLNKEKMPQHAELVKSYKNHQVKLMFVPVLLLMRSVLWHCVCPVPGSNEQNIKFWPKYDNGKVVIVLKLPFTEATFALNPFSVFISSADDASENEVVESLLAELEDEVKIKYGVTLKQFIRERAEFRNTLLYAGDAMSVNYVVDYNEISSTCYNAYEALLWSLAALLTNDPIAPNFGAVSQFIAIYKKVLLDSKVIRIKE